MVMRDPVCGMEVDEKTAKYSSEYSGAVYYFCSQGCKKRFDANPSQFARASVPDTKHVNLATSPVEYQARASSIQHPVSTNYTCPMHPEIVRDKPGTCPICGMALELRTATAEEEQNPELIDMSRRFWISIGLAIPILAFAMSDMLP